MFNDAKDFGAQLHGLIDAAQRTGQTKTAILQEVGRLLDNCARADSELIDRLGYLVDGSVSSGSHMFSNELPPGIMPRTQ